MNETTAPKAALAGVRVLDLSRVLAGPWATQILGDFGAEVIKIERPGVGDDTRAWGPPFLREPDGSSGDAAYFLAANRNKRSVAIDFAKPEGAELVRRLAPHCQVLVENFKIGTMQRWDLDYETVLKPRFPALIYCRISGFGADGPLGGAPGYDAVAQAMAEPRPTAEDVERHTYAPSPVDVVYPEDYTGLPGERR